MKKKSIKGYLSKIAAVGYGSKGRTKKKPVGSGGEEKKAFFRIGGIRAKILAAMYIPVLLMILFGIVCYVRTSSAITANYEKSTAETIAAVGDYLGVGLESVQNKAKELVFSNSLTDYYTKSSNRSTLDEMNKYNKLQDEIVVIQSMNSFIKRVIVLGENGRDMASDSSKRFLDNQVYVNFSAADEAKKIDESDNAGLWLGQHGKLDDWMGINKDNYAAAYARTFNSGKGYVIIDISGDVIKNRLSKINYGTGSMVSFVTSDGKEIMPDTKNEGIFPKMEAYKKAVSGGKGSGYSYQDYNGENYLFSYSKIGDTGFMICALVPKSFILRQADSIKQLIILFVFIAVLLTVAAGSIIAGGIGTAISKLVKSISAASRGDLTVRFVTKRRDEFMVLSNSLNDMINGIRNLIGEAADVGVKVNDSALQLSTASETILSATKDISLTIGEIEKGVVQQAQDTENCSGQMSGLSDKINQVYGSTREIEEIAEGTKVIVGDGILIIDDLKDKTQATRDITQEILNEIKALEARSKSIGNFVGIINNIASQTNLLSLNASIEAARAGQAGQGFAVVADEIRKLADESVKAAAEIKGIVEQIQKETRGTAVTAGKAESIVESQTQALHKTVDVFEKINRHVINLAGNLDTISMEVKGIESAKEDTVNAIGNISAVSEETAAAAEEVSQAAESQIRSVENLSGAALDLAGDAKKLQEMIQVFQM